MAAAPRRVPGQAPRPVWVGGIYHAALTLLLAGTALAEPAPAPAPDAAQHIQELAAQAMKAQKAGHPAECGEGFLAAYQQAPKVDRAGELLYNAAICFQEAGQLERALELFTQLMARPADPLTPRALLIVGRLEQRLLRFAAAAEHYEQFASKFAGEQYAPDALTDAARLRLGLGDSKTFSADVALFTKQYGKKRRSDAAALEYLEADALEQRPGGDKALITFLNGYLKTWNGTLRVDQRMAVLARLGDAEWRSSCKLGDGQAGLCVAPAAPLPMTVKGKRVRCAEAPALGLVARQATLAADAQKHFQAVLALWHSAGQPGADLAISAADAAAQLANMTRAAGLATLRSTDADFEAALAAPLPAVDKLQAMQVWLKGQQNGLQRMTQRYLSMMRVQPPSEWSLANIARIGQLYVAFDEAVARMALPPEMAANPDMTEGFCGGLGEQHQAIRAKALDAFSSCEESATRLGLAGPWRDLCERELARLDPAGHPLARELPPMSVPRLVPPPPALMTSPR